PPTSTLFPYTTLFRSGLSRRAHQDPDAVLYYCDAVRDLRHRGRVHLPVGRHLQAARPLRPDRDVGLHRDPARRLLLRLEEGGAGMGLIERSLDANIVTTTLDAAI